MDSEDTNGRELTAILHLYLPLSLSHIGSLPPSSGPQSIIIKGKDQMVGIKGFWR